MTQTATSDLTNILAAAQLPALPQSAIRLLELSKDPENGPAEFAVPVEADPGLAGQVLRFVNSSYFGFSREIDSVKLAITLVGVRTIKNFVLWSAVFSLMPVAKNGVLQLKNLWQDSLRRALFARSISKQLGLKDPEAPFAAALLQDLAVPLLVKEMGREYELLLDERDGGQARLSDLERERFGWTHAEAGGIIARKWNLPEEFAQLIELHIDLETLLQTGNTDPALAAVSLSALLPVCGDAEWLERQALESAYQQVGPADSLPLAALLADIDQQFIEFAPVLEISDPGKSLAAWFSETAARDA